jgi:hypothetical protein
MYDKGCLWLMGNQALLVKEGKATLLNFMETNAPLYNIYLNQAIAQNK